MAENKSAQVEFKELFAELQTLAPLVIDDWDQAKDIQRIKRLKVVLHRLSELSETLMPAE